MLDLPGERGVTIGDWMERLITGMREVCMRGCQHKELKFRGDDMLGILYGLEERMEELGTFLRSPVLNFQDEEDVRRCMTECLEFFLLAVGNQDRVQMLDIFRESVRSIHQRWEGIQPARLPDGSPIE